MIFLIFNNIIQISQVRQKRRRMMTDMKYMITMCLLVIALLAESNATEPVWPLKKLIIYNEKYELVYPIAPQITH